MAIYHLSVQIIGRNSGRSSVAAAAYRAAEKLLNEYDGLEHDFTKKNFVEYTKIILPDNAPKKFSDRSTLWNAVEMSEKSKDAQLCREFEIALPVELTKEQQIELAEKFARESLVSQGMIADIAIHNPPVMNDRHQPIDKDGNPIKDREMMQYRNPHAHILTSLRPLDENGKWMAKSKTEYLCIKNGEERGFTAEEFKIAKEDGWEKQYKYVDGKNRIWLPAEEGQARGLERVNRSPKTTPYGRKNEIIEYWNSPDRIIEWRQTWEKVVNEKLKSLSLDVRIDCRSFADQGRTEETPTLHMGTAATNMERRARRELAEGKTHVEHSDIAEINKQIKEHNKLVREIKAKMQRMVKVAKEIAEQAAKKLEGIRARIIGNKYQETILTAKMKKYVSKLDPERERIEKYSIEADKIKKADAKASRQIVKIQDELDACSPLQIIKKKQLQEQIDDLNAEITARKDYMASVAEMTGFESADDFKAKKEELRLREKSYEKLEKAVEKLRQANEGLTDDYRTEEKASAESRTAIEAIREKLRSRFEGIIKDKLRQKYAERYDESVFSAAIKHTDDLIGSQGESRTKEKTMTRSH